MLMMIYACMYITGSGVTQMRVRRGCGFGVTGVKGGGVEMWRCGRCRGGVTEVKKGVEV